MARKSLDLIIGQLRGQILMLGSIVEHSTIDAVNALTHGDFGSAQVICQKNLFINEKRCAIENAVLEQIATQAPIAHDLRTLTAIFLVANELNQMGQYARSIARVVRNISDEDIRIPAREFQEMARLSVGMLRKSLTAFISENSILAGQIPGEDDQVDNLYDRIYHILVCNMIANPETIDEANYLLRVAHNLERMADRVVNICERTIFICTGELLELDQDEYSILSKTQTILP
jgi:phosphate transport system protein